MLANDALSTIGNTPLVRLRGFEPENGAEIWLKLEGGNPTGSYKDRMAVAVLGRALERGDIRPGDRVVEYTGGSTGTALAFVSAVLSLRFTAVFSDAFSDSKRLAMEAFGAQVLVEPSEGGRITVNNQFPLEAAELYWHFVDGIWVILYGLLYLL
jgi:cysteine synthase A